MYLNISKAKKELGWKAKKNLNDMVIDTLKYVNFLEKRIKI